MSTMNNAAETTMMDQGMVNANEALLNKKKIGLMISAAAIIPFIISASLGAKYEWADNMILVNIVMAIISYIVSGGIRNILSIAKKWAIFGWFVFPFPYDLATGAGMLALAIICFIYFPFAFVLYDYIKTRKSM
ncbi:hypothetical protein [Butyrivibrio sp. ob235]|uniref:hypothetical protein n=1 Tax=Butyrivibrio sp. ob235 TaxID=1761780 RepID=UPI001113E4A3|nr:hypothetical protein [Butyrivibrio sp. ob235]